MIDSENALVLGKETQIAAHAYDAGYEQGVKDAELALKDAYNDGYDDGHNDGYQAGYEAAGQDADSTDWGNYPPPDNP